MKPNLSCSLLENLDMIRDQLGNSSDVMKREVTLGDTARKMAICYIDGIVDSERVEEQIIAPITSFIHNQYDEGDEIVKTLTSTVIKTKGIKEVSACSNLINEMIQGNTVILAEGSQIALSADTAKLPERSIPEPKTQRTQAGPNVSFNESRTSNIALIRKYLKDPNLRVDSSPLNETVRTSVTILYVDGKVDHELLTRIKTKLEQVKIPVILDTNYIHEAITDETKSIFPLAQPTDRPDVVAAELLSGKIAIFVDGSPFVLTLPTVFVQLFQAPDDYYSLTRGFMWVRLARIFFVFLSTLLPALYISFTVFHPGMVPTQLLVGILAQRDFVPFPTVIEVLVFYFLIVIVTESSLRLPQGIVFTLSILASVTLGQLAVEAQLVQPTTLVVLGATYVMATVSPSHSLNKVTKKLTLHFIYLASFLGLFGIIVGFIALLLHLSSLRSFGVPYLSPMAPFHLADQKDTIFRLPMQKISQNEKKFTKEEPMKKRN